MGTMSMGKTHIHGQPCTSLISSYQCTLPEPEHLPLDPYRTLEGAALVTVKHMDKT